LAIAQRVRYDSPGMATSAQKTAVVLAFVAAGLSFLSVAAGFLQNGRIQVTPLLGGLFMLALGIGGLNKLRSSKP
jgi:hypothetical protein